MVTDGGHITLKGTGGRRCLLGLLLPVGVMVDWQINELHGVTHPKEQGLETSPDLLVSPMLAQNICWIVLPRKMDRIHNAGCSGLSDSVEQKDEMVFVQFGMQLGTAVNHALVVTKHDASLADGDTKVSQCILDIHCLFDTGSPCYKLGAICSSLHGGLFL